MPTSQIVYLIVCGCVVFVVLLVGIPYRARRSFLALYDQGSAISIFATLSVMSMRVSGWPMWVGGFGGLIGGLSAALFVHWFRHKVVLTQTATLLLFYVCSFGFFVGSTMAGTVGARWIMGT